MSAGLPGVGLSGIFFIVSALAAVPLELGRTLQRRSSLDRWAAVLRHFAFAVVMIASLELFYATVHLALARLPHISELTHGLVAGGRAASGVHLQAIPVLPVLATLGLVACVIALAKGADVVSRVSQRAPTLGFRSAATRTALRDRAARQSLVVLMTAGSLAVWTLIPLGGLWAASRLSASSTQLSLASLVVMAAIIPGAMFLATKALILVERAYVHTSESTARVDSLRGSRNITDCDALSQTSTLEKIMVTNLVLAVGGLAIWLFVGSSLFA
jgi:hypothetical protein